MPTYDYVCDACGATWEEFQSMNDKPLRKCPECKKLKARRLIGAGAGLIFKGSGFYVTDYKKSGSSASGGAKKGESSSESSGSSSSKDSSSKSSKPKKSDAK